MTSSGTTGLHSPLQDRGCGDHSSYVALVVVNSPRGACGQGVDGRLQIQAPLELDLLFSVMQQSNCHCLFDRPNTFFDKYWLNVRARIAPVMQNRMETKICRRWKFEARQKEQRAVKNLSTDLLDGMSPKDTLVVWDNGGFGPSTNSSELPDYQKMLLANPIY